MKTKCRGCGKIVRVSRRFAGDGLAGRVSWHRHPTNLRRPPSKNGKQWCAAAADYVLKEM